MSGKPTFFDPAGVVIVNGIATPTVPSMHPSSHGRAWNAEVLRRNRKAERERLEIELLRLQVQAAKARVAR